MNIYLGNLSVTDIEKRAGVTFPAALHDFMSGRKQEEASKIAHGKWHCFDLPFVLVCGDIDTAKRIHQHLSALSSRFKEPLRISLSEGAQS